MKKLVCLFSLCCLLWGCGAGETTTVCEGNINGIDIQVTLVHNETEALRQSVTNETNLIYFSVTEEMLEGLLAETVETYENIEGLTYEYEINDGILTEIITVDYENGDLDALEEAGLVSFNGLTGEDKYIDYKLTMDAYTQQGLTCKQNEEKKY